ncbi:MAG TPA: fluoride efflux transporter CrcB [Sphingomicrobium sp.]|nr:fluoride efflux transporter CrcB [Sphingomicrobium sp.]
MPHALGYLLVFVGGGLGATARHAVGRAGLALLGPGFPWWTMAVNVAGSFAIGLLAGLFGAFETGPNARLFLTTGFLGGFTTFSAFSLDALTLWERGAALQAGLYVAGSVIASLIAAFAGLMASRLA